jgi:hypothetical protein
MVKWNQSWATQLKKAVNSTQFTRRKLQLNSIRFTHSWKKKFQFNSTQFNSTQFMNWIELRWVEFAVFWIELPSSEWNWVLKTMRSRNIYVVRRELFFFLTFFLDVRIKSLYFVTRWSQERKIRNYSFKGEMKISKLNRYHFFSNLYWEVLFNYKEPNKKANWSMDFVFF